MLRASSDAPLPVRLRRVRVLLRRGLSNKLIAHEMQVSEGTVKNYMTELFRHLGVSNRTQAALTEGDGWVDGTHCQPARQPFISDARDMREVPGGW